MQSLGQLRRGASLLPRLAPAAARITTTTAEQSAAAQAAADKAATNTPLMREFAIYRRAQGCVRAPCAGSSVAAGAECQGLCLRRWNPDLGEKPTYQSYKIDLNRQGPACLTCSV